MINWVKKVKKKFIKKIKLSDLLNRNKFSIVEVVLLLFFTLFIGIVIGYFITFKLTRVVESKDTTLISNVYDSILNNYYKEITLDELEKAAVSGVVEYLDDENTIELYDQTFFELKEQINGYFCGIGVNVVFENNKLVIVNVIEGSISEKVGILVDDIIYDVDGIRVNQDNFLDLIKGSCETNLKLGIKRDEEYLNFDLIRESISINSVTSQYFDVGDKYVGYIDIDVFSLNTYDDFRENLKKLEDKNIKSLIIDLRNNPGGVVSSARKIMNIFFKKNTTLYKSKSRNVTTIIKDNSKESRDYPIIILMNECTASASEIFVSGFKENYKDIILVGKTTYGKNTIQNNLSLTDNYGIKYTSSEWYTSNNKSVKDIGIIPDIVVDNGGFSFYDDTQLQEAINILK